MFNQSCATLVRIRRHESGHEGFAPGSHVIVRVFPSDCTDSAEEYIYIYTHIYVSVNVSSSQYSDLLGNISLYICECLCLYPIAPIDWEKASTGLLAGSIGFAGWPHSSLYFR